MPDKEIVMYSRAAYSPFVALARDVFSRYKIPFREIDITVDTASADQLRAWSGKLSIPTIVATAPQTGLPLEPPTPLKPGQSPRGLDRGSLISEPNNQQLENWLHKHGFLARPYKR
jgi:hypothetical protein